MSLYKKSGFWYYDFIFSGKRFQGSTRVRNINLARLVEAKVRSDVALERFGIIQPKTAPVGKDFFGDGGQFLAHVRKHNAMKPRTVRFYEEHAARLLKYSPFATLRLNQIDEEVISGYEPKAAVATINGDLRTLRKALNLALEWRLIARRPKIRILPGERQRDFILTGELETRYLALIDYPLKQAAILMLDLGLRPDECVRLKKGSVNGDTLTVLDGKSVNAARSLPLTERAILAIELVSSLWPDSEWLFQGRGGEHLRRTSLDNIHAKVRKEHDLPKEFVLYSLRHTFGTRLSESGASPFDVKMAMGHGSIHVTQRYVHPTADHLRLALARKEALDKMLRGEIHEEASAEKLKTS